MCRGDIIAGLQLCTSYSVVRIGVDKSNWNTGAVAKLARKASFSRDYSQLFISYTEVCQGVYKITNTGAGPELAKKKFF